MTRRLSAALELATRVAVVPPGSAVAAIGAALSGAALSGVAGVRAFVG